MTMRIGLVQIRALLSVCSQIEPDVNKLSIDSTHNNAENPITADAGTLPAGIVFATGWF